MQSIGTHNGKFHCDEVFACYMLKKLPVFKNHAIIRTRDNEILSGCEVVVDVGAVFDSSSKRFDHHQSSFNKTMNTLLGLNYHTRLSSAGLVYAYYGKELIAHLLKIASDDNCISILFDKLYETFVESVDAIDNGIEHHDGTPRYKLSSTLASRVDHLNPAWNDKQTHSDKQFEKAMKLVGEEFEDRVHYFYNSWIPARDLVTKAIEDRKEVHPSGKILEIKPCGLPYKQHFFALEKEMGLEKEDICLVIYKDETNNSYRVQAIPLSENSGFKNRVTLPWKGLRDTDLEYASGVNGAIFVHVNGFIGGAKTRESALAIATETLNQEKKLKV